MPIDWDRMDQPTYDRIVEALLSRTLAGEGQVDAFNGRGGDGGRDVVLTRHDGSVVIYQLKYFVGGLHFGNRKRQIKKSFESVLGHAPAEWVLVIPDTLTDGEKRWLAALPGTVKPPSSVPTDYLDRPRLDVAFAEHEDLLRYFTIDVVKEHASLWRRDDAVIERLADIAHRVKGLGDQAGYLDPYWDVDFARVGDMVVQTLRAKTPDAARLSPIDLKFNAVFAEDQQDLKERFIRAIEYGPSGRLRLPASSVEDFVVSGPEWIAGERQDVEVEWVALPSVATGRPVELRISGESGRILATHRGVVDDFAGGIKGHTLVASFHERSLVVEFRLPGDDGSKGQLDFSLPAERPLPRNLLRALQFRRHLLSGVTLEIFVEGQRVGLLEVDSGSSKALEDAHYVQLEEIASDLSTVQDHLQQDFPIPEEVSGLDRVRLRALRLLLAGEVVVLPDTRRMTAHLSGTDGPGLRTALSSEGTALVADQPDCTMHLFDRELHLGHVRFYTPSAVVTNGPELIAALDSGTAAGAGATFEPLNGRHFRAYKPEFLAKRPATVRVASWGLAGIPEPPDEGEIVHTDATPDVGP